jgi:hypothetical protein
MFFCSIGLIAFCLYQPNSFGPASQSCVDFRSVRSSLRAERIRFDRPFCPHINMRTDKRQSARVPLLACPAVYFWRLSTTHRPLYFSACFVLSVVYPSVLQPPVSSLSSATSGHQTSNNRPFSWKSNLDIIP